MTVIDSRYHVVEGPLEEGLTAVYKAFDLQGLDPYGDRTAPYDLLEKARRAARGLIPEPLRPTIDRCLDTEAAGRPLNALVLAAELDVALQQAERDTTADELTSSPKVYLTFREGTLAGLESDLYLDRRAVERYLADELTDDIWVGSPQEGTFSLVTSSMSIRCKVAVDGATLVATSAVSRPGSELDRDRDRAAGRPSYGSSSANPRMRC